MDPGPITGSNVWPGAVICCDLPLIYIYFKICLPFTFISRFTSLPHSSSYTPYPHLCPLLCHFGQRYHHHCRQGKCVEWCGDRSKRGSPRLNSSTTSPTGHRPVDSVHCKYYTEDSSPGLDNYLPRLSTSGRCSEDAQ